MSNNKRNGNGLAVANNFGANNSSEYDEAPINEYGSPNDEMAEEPAFVPTNMNGAGRKRKASRKGRKSTRKTSRKVGRKSTRKTSRKVSRKVSRKNRKSRK